MTLPNKQCLKPHFLNKGLFPTTRSPHFLFQMNSYQPSKPSKPSQLGGPSYQSIYMNFVEVHLQTYNQA